MKMNFGNNFLTVPLVLLKGRLSNWRCLVCRAALCSLFCSAQSEVENILTVMPGIAV